MPHSPPTLTQSSTPRSASGADAASCSASFIVSASRSAAGTTRLTMPSSRARAGVDGGADQAQLQRGRAASQAQQALGAAEARDQAEVDLRLADLRGIGGHAQVAAHGQFQPAAQRETVDHADHRLGHLLDPAHQLLPAEGEIAPLDRGQAVHLGDVRPGHEGLRTGAGQDHAPDLRVRGRRLEGLAGGLPGSAALSAFSLSGRLTVIRRTAPLSAIRTGDSDMGRAYERVGTRGKVVPGAPGTSGPGAGSERFDVSGD